MNETNLERWARTHTSRLSTKEDQIGERQCAVWVNSPDDEKSGHPGNRLYQYVTHDKANPEVWLCRKCLLDVSLLDYFAERDHRTLQRPLGFKMFGMPKISVAEIDGEKTYDLMLLIRWSSEGNPTNPV